MATFSDILKKAQGAITDLVASSGSKEASVVGIDIGSSSIKVVQLRKSRGSAVLETYGELALGPYAGLEVGQATNLPAEKLAEALTDIMREANVTTKDAGISVPLSASLVSLISLPTKDQKEIARMVPLEARKYIPVPISEVALDWFVLPEEEAKYLGTPTEGADGARKTNVLIVAIHNDILTKFQAAAQGAAVVPSFFEIETFSTARSSLEQDVSPIMIVDIGAATTKMYIVEFGIVQVSHATPKGSQDITLALSKSLNLSLPEAETRKRERGLMTENTAIDESISLSLDYLMAEAGRVLLTYQKRSNKVVTKVVFSGGGSALRGIAEYAKKFIDVPIELANPFTKTETPAFIEDALKGAGPTFAVAVGLALRKLQEKK